jgi:iron complex outermembrane receptor protein
MSSRISAYGAICSLLLVSSASFAQLEEVVVTAQKRAETLATVPITMQAFTGEQISDLGIKKASDITRLAPNLNISGQNSANQQINIRGVGTSDFFGTATGAVGVYMDEVTMSAPYLSGLGLYDLERVEVLRGPQNSLFGRNTTGGAVNYISRMPEIGGSTDGYFDLMMGNFGLIEATTAATLQLSDSSALRLAGKFYSRDGIWNNLSDNGSDFGEKERHALRATLAVDYSEATRLTFSAHIADEDSEMDPVNAVGTRIENGIPENGPVPTTRLPDQVDFETYYPDTYNNQGDNPSTARWEDVYVNHSQPFQLENVGAYLKIEHDMDWASFASITSMDHTEMRWGYDVSGNANPGNASGLSTWIETALGGPAAAPQYIQAINQDQEYDQWSQEFRLVSGDDAAFKWIAGLYFFGEDSKLGQNINFGISALPYGGPPAGGGLVILAFGGNPASQQTSFSYGEVENFVWSPYVQAEFNISDRASMTVGLRYTDDTKELPVLTVGNFDNSVRPVGYFWGSQASLAQLEGAPLCDLDGDGNLFNSPGDPDNVGTYCQQELGGPQEDLDFGEFGGKIGLDFQVNDDLLVYTSYSRGFRSGKSDIEFIHGPHTGIPRQNVEVEFLNALEAGVKSTLADGAVQFNAAVYHYVWDDQQQFFVGPQGPDFVNIDESKLWGVEAELQWAPTSDLLIQAGLGFQDTEITESSDEAAAEVGHELPFAADTSANLLVVKDFHVGNKLVSAQFDYQYRSAPKAYAKMRSTVNELEETSQLNARVSWEFGSEGQYELALWGDNLTEDKRCSYKWELTAVGGGAYCVTTDGQAMYGLSGRVTF